MLRLTIHGELLAARCPENVLAVLDIGYLKKSYLADYQAMLFLRGVGESAPAVLRSYPRWSASLWDLVARALTAALYRAEQPPPAAKPDRRCAYATKLCASLQKTTDSDDGIELATLELLQPGPRGRYRASFTEGILGRRTGEFEYGCKVLNPVDLVLRAILWTHVGADTLPAVPKLLTPEGVLRIDGVERFHIAALAEPARTGFLRFMADRSDKASAESMPLASDYVTF